MRKSPVLRSINLVLAISFASGVGYLSTRGAGPLPALGPAFNPGTGVWTIQADAKTPKTESLKIPGLHGQVSVMFDATGVAHIKAQDAHDLYLAMGYTHARFRLQQMDLMRRQGQGLLSQVVGQKALPSDEFELQLGLRRTAEKEWKAMSPSDEGRAALLAYTEGVNDRIDEDIGTGNLPYTFKLLGYQPAQWTPIDSLVIQGDMTQTLDYTNEPLDYALLVKSLGYQKTMSLFPVFPIDEQHPYDTGPYPKDGVTPFPVQTSISESELEAVQDIQSKSRLLPASAIHHGSNSNNWAVDGTKTASGKPLMAGDPHLEQTLPSIWYQVEASAPGTTFSGVSIPGLPGILIGHNRHISWSLTDVQDQQTFFYMEKTDSSHPNQYFWNGAWRPMNQFHYAIPVKGQGKVPFTVRTTVHGPIITEKGQTMSVYWLGDVPTPDLDVFLNIIHASNFADFKRALSEWHLPNHNFVYADDAGNIGLISAGYYPIVKHGDPWLPLSGTGEDDVTSVVPYGAIPEAYDPPSHIVFSANQRPVGNNYPYYIGTTLDFFDNGYRADQIYQTLKNRHNLTVKDMEALQNNTQDYLAQLIVPKLLNALPADTASATSAEEQQAKQLLVNWNDSMDANSPAASVWWLFWNHYVQDTFGPLWAADHVPVKQDSDLSVSETNAGGVKVVLDEDLEAWTLRDPSNRAFNLPNGTKRTAQTVMRQAFMQTIQELNSKLGKDPSKWQWGKLHSRQFASLLQIPELGYGPYPSGGDNWTVDAADSSNGYLSTAGPSWRFIMDWGTGKGIGVYPGGQSEDPLSPWYSNLIGAWWSGNYNPMQDYSQVLHDSKAHQTWSLHP